VLIPLGTDRPSHRRAVVTPALIIINLLVFAILAGIDRGNPARFEAIHEFFWLRRGDLKPWAFFSYAFLHVNALHVGMNMVFLWVFGPSIEDRLGRVWFSLFYLAGAAAAGALHIAFEEAPVVGASGAVAAINGAFLVLFPLSNIRCLWLLGGSQTWVSAWWFIGFAIAIDLLLARWDGGIARLAHLGGYAFGGGLSFALLATGLLPQETYDAFAMVRQAQRRRAMREAVVSQQQEIARRLNPAERDPDQEALAAARAEVSRLAGTGDLAAAGRAYGALLERFPSAATALTTMSRRLQLDLGNHLFATGENRVAAAAYERFAGANPSDRESPKVLLLAAVICARRLHEKARAHAALAAIEGKLTDPDEQALAAQLRSELGMTHGPSAGPVIAAAQAGQSAPVSR
jgi:membrane associated rhomboid family serine protease